MPKVKKRAVVAGVRNAIGKRGSVKKSAPIAKRGAPKQAKQLAPKGRPARAPEVQVAIKVLDPWQKCGSGTSVQFLYRVDERVDGRTVHHLVFFDHHGWYCEHGRDCPAVKRAKKFNGQSGRVS